MIARCAACQAEFVTYPSYVKRRPAGGYCSKRCYGTSLKVACARCGRDLPSNRKQKKVCAPCSQLLRHERSLAIFNGRIDKTGPCWLWTGVMNPNGYGWASVGSVRGFAHRVQWVLMHGQIPKTLCVCHRCDNPRCVNPEHLFLGTYRDNVHDSINKGRFSAWAETGMTLSGVPAKSIRSEYCRRGHKKVDRQGYRYCRECAVVRNRRYYQSHKHQEAVSA